MGKVGTEAWTGDAFIRQMVEEYKKQEEMEEEMERAEEKRMKMTDGSPPARSLRSPWTGRSQRT